MSIALKENLSWNEINSFFIYGSFLVIQLVLAYFYYNHLQLDAVANIGWLVFMASGVLGWLPIFTLKKKGGVSQGKSYIQTTVLVDCGIYSIVRHPQYLAGVLMSLASVLISQYWLNAILLIPVAAGFYWDSLRADRNLVEKFGIQYEVYMEEVSGMNLLKGVLRKLSGKNVSKDQ